MSKRKPKHQAPVGNQAINTPSAFAGIGSFSSGTGFTAADQSTSRGYLYFPNLDNRTALGQSSRIEMIRKARWLETNMGLGRHFANTIPRLVGPLIPQPSTSDTAWNQLAIAFFQRTQGSRMIHDQSGAESFFTRQKTVIKRGLVDGDCVLALTSTSTGHARTVFYEGPQVGNGNEQTRENGWYDGVKLDKWGRREAVCILEPGMYNRKGTTIPASRILHCGRFESPQSPRGLTGFTHAINHMVDIREIDNDTKRGIKAANLFGLVITNKALDGIDSAPASGKYKTRDYTGAKPTGVDSPTPTKYEEILDGGGNVATLNQGQDVKIINDSRRHPNQQQVIEYFIQDCSLGFGLPYEVMWRIAGITGPAVRFVMRMTEKTLNEMRSGLTEQFCQPFWSYSMALAIKNGYLPQCKDPDWWKCNWIAPSALTIDAGRDSAAGIREIEVGAQTLQDWYGEDGQDWRQQLSQVAIEKAFAIELEKKHKLEPGTVLGQRELNQAQSENAAKTPPV